MQEARVTVYVGNRDADLRLRIFDAKPDDVWASIAVGKSVDIYIDADQLDTITREWEAWKFERDHDADEIVFASIPTWQCEHDSSNHCRWCEHTVYAVGGPFDPTRHRILEGSATCVHGVKPSECSSCATQRDLAEDDRQRERY